MLAIIRQLQGFEAPANAWEPRILTARISRYDPQVLLRLRLEGLVGWGRLSPHPATLEPNSAPARSVSRNFTQRYHSERNEESRAALLRHPLFSGSTQSEILRSAQDDSERARNDIPAMAERRITPSSVAPITFFVREESDWMIPRHASLPEVSRSLSEVAREVLEYVRRHGASFFADIVRGTGKLKSEVETALWELVAAGLFTADGFEQFCAPSSIPSGGPDKGEGARLAHVTAQGDGHCSFPASRRIAPRPSRRFAACCWSATEWCFES